MAGAQDSCEPVQALFPLELFRELLPRRHPIPLESDGADSGNPRQGTLEKTASLSKADEARSDSQKDSGIGRSVTSAESDQRVSPGSLSRMRDLTRSHIDTRRGTLKANSAEPADGETFTWSQYTVGIICALPKELIAVRSLFDRTHKSLDKAQNDSNQYVLGQMGHHMAVAACLPAGEYGTNSAAAVASNMSTSFRSIRFCLLVGIGGGVPSGDNDICLGDVVVGLPPRTYPSVIQYDLGKENDGGSFEPTGSLSPPPRELTTAISVLRSDPGLRIDPLRSHLSAITSQMSEYSCPGEDFDVCVEDARRSDL
ncbi:hypothetical protein V1506DRAFT_524218 [Lipomyces tetrasporus]